MAKFYPLLVTIVTENESNLHSKHITKNCDFRKKFGFDPMLNECKFFNKFLKNWARFIKLTNTDKIYIYICFRSGGALPQKSAEPPIETRKEH